MARINIEEKLFSDRRWMKLILKTGCHHKSLGLLTGAWMLAQKTWLKFGAIPEKSWDKELDVLIEVEFATRRADGSVYIKGSRRAFAWLNQRSEGGQRISEKKLKSLEKARNARWNIEDLSLNGSERNQNESERNLNGSEAPTLTLTPTLSPSLTLSQTHAQAQPQSLTQSTNEESINTLKVARKKSTTSDKESLEIKQANRQIWESYFNAYRYRYGVDPVRNASVNAQVDQLRKRLGTEDAMKVVEFYLTHNESFYVKKTHALGLCLKDAETLRTQMARGKAITTTMVRSFEKVQTTQETLDHIRREGI